ncbi:5-hydroxytryptamine receptor 3A-like [Xiphophorus hellerii]|uniref:5-hydroxytryptamine receptor 3A-like n=1 Tax=Xiphophorus hellerii TaxID=8084 RepID=UPI0013B39B21|nr:5-hydroxytryptamine receptor 3A-like [Xiphophorus hellerii]
MFLLTASTCSYQNVLDHLQLTKANETFTMSRPVKDHTNKTVLYLEMIVYAILDVKETDQTFIAYVWIYMEWGNDYALWNKDDFCGISEIIVPTEVLWKPDLTIEEMVEKDKAPPSPFLKIHSNGSIEFRNDQIVISACRMHVYKFPFDIQKCNITFKSYLYAEHELEIDVERDSSVISKWSREIMATEFEWVFVNMSVTSSTVNHYGYNQTVVVYTITMKRKSALYVGNFLLPVLFFLCLDFASLLMPTGGGEKISFKITVLLAVTVMQLILIEIIPVTASRIPVIVIYCIGVFALMLLGFLETIFLNYLMEKDSSSLESKKESVKLQIIKASSIASTCDEMTDQTPSMCKGGSSSQLTELFLAVEKVSDELGEMKKAFLEKESEEKKDGYWTGVAKKIDKIFSILYVLSAILFLAVVFSVWLSKSDSSE